MRITAAIKQAVPLFPEFRFAEPVNWEMRRGENWAVAGRNGAGKSVLADILLRRVPLKEGVVEIDILEGRTAGRTVKSIGFRDIYSLVDIRDSFYQQRWNSDARDATPLAGTLFDGEELERSLPMLRQFGMQDALEKRIVSLSSGELRKFLIVRALACEPRILIIDNPFVGLDEASRRELSVMLGKISSQGTTQFVLLVSDPGDVPRWIDKVLPVEDMSIGAPVNAQDFITRGYKDIFPEPDGRELPARECNGNDDFKVFADLENVRVAYGDKIILDNVSWRVGRGEKWALLGPNGSGKSTLLSLLYGDNPQAYANRITLFDRRRGSGESIWDIKSGSATSIPIYIHITLRILRPWK